MDSETYEIIPINHSCSNSVKHNIQPQLGSQSAQSHNNIDNITNQHISDSQYDNINDNNTLNPLHGGFKKIIKTYNISLYNNAIIKVRSNNELNAIKNILKKNIFKLKKNNILIITNKNITNIYLIKRL